MGREKYIVAHGSETGEQPIKDNLEVIRGGTSTNDSPEKSNTTPGTTEPNVQAANSKSR